MSEALNCSLDWVVINFVPFGDLLSDYWLWLSIPREKPDNYNCSEALFTFMRGVLGTGTVIDSIPECALAVAILIGAMKGLVVGGASGELPQDREQLGLTTLPRSLLQHLWKTISDGKNIVLFAFKNRSETDEPPNCRNMMHYLAFYTIVMLHFPFMWAMRPFVGSHRYYHIVAIQALGGVLTLTASIFFAVLSGEPSAIASASFGAYTLGVSTVVAIWSGPEERGNAVASDVVTTSRDNSTTVIDTAADVHQESAPDGGTDHNAGYVDPPSCLGPNGRGNGSTYVSSVANDAPSWLGSTGGGNFAVSDIATRSRSIPPNSTTETDTGAEVHQESIPDRGADRNAGYVVNDAFLDYVPPGRWYYIGLPLVYYAGSMAVAVYGFWNIVGDNTDSNGFLRAIVGFSLLGIGFVYSLCVAHSRPTGREQILGIILFGVLFSCMIFVIVFGAHEITAYRSSLRYGGGIAIVVAGACLALPCLQMIFLIGEDDETDW